MNYYGNPYNNQYYIQDLQNMRDRIDQQMRQMQTPQMQNQQQPAINQTFQLAPNQTANDLEGKFASNIDEVKNTLVMKTGIFTNKDYSIMWIKDVTGEIRTFNTSEIIEMDEKDKQILELQKQKENDNNTILMLQKEIENIKNSIQTSIVPTEIVEEKPKKGANK